MIWASRQGPTPPIQALTNVLPNRTTNAESACRPSKKRMPRVIATTTSTRKYLLCKRFPFPMQVNIQDRQSMRRA